MPRLRLWRLPARSVAHAFPGVCRRHAFPGANDKHLGSPQLFPSNDAAARHYAMSNCSFTEMNKCLKLGGSNLAPNGRLWVVFAATTAAET